MRITLRRSRLLPTLIVATLLLCLVALLLTGLQLADAWNTSLLIPVAVSSAVLLVWMTWRALRSPQFNCHVLELLGNARYRVWLIGAAGAQEHVIQRWQKVGPLLLIEFEPAPQPLRLLLAADQCDPNDWRALCAALNWERTET